jgi:hypothetical protein
MISRSSVGDRIPAKVINSFKSFRHARRVFALSILANHSASGGTSASWENSTLVRARRGSVTCSDPRPVIHNAASWVLWSINVDTEIVRRRIRAIVGSSPFFLEQMVALMRSDLADDGITSPMRKALVAWSVGEPHDEWLTPGPDSVLVLQKESLRRTMDVCLNEERQLQSETMQQALLAARSALLGCRDQRVLKLLDGFVQAGVPGVGGFVIDQIVSEGYGSTMVGAAEPSFPNKLGELWGLLRSAACRGVGTLSASG